MASRHIEEAQARVDQCKQALTESVLQLRQAAAQEIYEYLQERFNSTLKGGREEWINARPNESLGDWFYRVQQVGDGWGSSVLHGNRVENARLADMTAYPWIQAPSVAKELNRLLHEHGVAIDRAMLDAYRLEM